MKYKLAFIATPMFSEYLKKNIQRFEKDFQFQIYEYNHISEVMDIYNNISSNNDGICTMGFLSLEIIIRNRKSADKPISCISSQLDEYYKEFFLLQCKNKNIDFSRIVLDATISVESLKARSVLELFQDDFALEALRESTLKNLSDEGLSLMIPQTIDVVVALWEQKKIDMVICKFSSVSKALSERGIPNIFIYPSVNNMASSLENIKKEIQLKNSMGNLPGAIFITSKKLQDSPFSDVTQDSIDIQRAVLEYNKQNMTGFFIQRSSIGIEIFTSQAVIGKITKSYSICPISSYISVVTSNQVRVVYGIGNDIAQARNNAYSALKNILDDGQSILSDGENSFIRLNSRLDCENDEKGFANLSNIAEESGLSQITIQRILMAIEALGTNKMTTQDLAGALKVTAANANNFLNNLVKSGYAQITAMQKSSGKGRPSHIYEIKLHEKSEK